MWGVSVDDLCVVYQKIKSKNLNDLPSLDRSTLVPFLPYILHTALPPLDTSGTSGNGSGYLGISRISILPILVTYKECNVLRTLMELPKVKLKGEALQRFNEVDKSGEVVWSEEDEEIFEKGSLHQKMVYFLVHLYKLGRIKEEMNRKQEEARCSMRCPPNLGSVIGMNKSIKFFSQSNFQWELEGMAFYTARYLGDVFPLSKIISSFLITHTDAGTHLINSLLLNLPESSSIILSTLLTNASMFFPTSKGNGFDFAPPHSSITLSHLPHLLLRYAHLQPNSASEIRNYLINGGILPEVQIFLTSKFIYDDVAFYSSFFLGPDVAYSFKDIMKWVPDYAVAQMRKGLMMRGSEVLKGESGNGREQFGKISALLKLYTCFIGIAEFQLDSAEFGMVVQLIRWCFNKNGLTEFKNGGHSLERIIKLTLCFVILWILTHITDQENFNGKEDILTILKYMVNGSQWNAKNEIEGMDIEDEKDTMMQNHIENINSVSPFLLLISIYFHSQQYPLIMEWIEDTLQIALPGRIKSGKLIQVSNSEMNTLIQTEKFWTKNVMNTSMVANCVSMLPVEKNLNLHSKNISIDCAYQLLKGKVFESYPQFWTIKDWIFRQIENSGEPVHPLFPALLEQFSERMIHNKIEKIPPSKITELIKASKTLPPIILTLFLALDFNYQVKKIVMEDKKQNTEELNKRYDEELLNQFNIKFLISQIASSNQASFSSSSTTGRVPPYNYIFPQLFERVVAQFPHLFDSNSNIDTEIFKDFKGIPETSNIPSILPTKNMHDNTILVEMELKRGRKRKRDSHSLSQDKEGMYDKLLDVLGFISKLICKGSQKEVYHLSKDFAEKWKAFYEAMPNSPLPFQTIRKFLEFSENSGDDKMETEEQLIQDPLLILRINRSMLYVPPLYDIILILLAHYLRNSNLLIEERISLQENNVPVLGTLLYGQSSAAVQVVLELMINEQLEIEERGILEEIRTLSCSFVHQRFLERPLLIKIIHFQTYPNQLIPLVVSGVPSIHICLDFLNEMLASPIQNLRMFAFEFGSHLIQQYSIPKSLSVASNLVNFIQKWGLVKSTEFQHLTLSCIEKISSAFPVLIPNIVHILSDYKRNSLYHSTNDPILQSLERIFTKNIVTFLPTK